MISAVLVIAAVTFVASLVLPVAVKPLLQKLGIVDVPNERSSHTRTTLRGLGLATLLAMLVGYVTAFVFVPASPLKSSVELVAVPFELPFTASTQSLALLGVIATVAVFSALLGLAEDLKGLRVLLRSILQLAVAAFATLAFISYNHASWLWLVYGILFLSSYINVANFMDGINGISGTHGLLAGVTFAIAGCLAQNWWLALSGAILAAAFAGFLPWNLTKPGAFLGDVGSYLLGAGVAATALAAGIAGIPWLATIGPMIIYFGDVGFTLVKRVRAGNKWYEPHREHVYERINQMGYSHLQSTLIVSGFTALASALGLASFWVTGFGWWMLLAAGLLLTGLYLALPRLLPSRHGT